MHSAINIGNMHGFKSVDQLGIVVGDLDQAMKEFSQVWGVRTWYVDNRDPGSADKITFRGKPIVRDTRNALGYCGAMQLELVQTGSQESIYTAHLAEHGEGLHHLGFFVRNLDARLAAYAKRGMEPVQTCELRSNGGTVTRCAYIEKAGANGITIELVETRLFGIPTRFSPMMMEIGALAGELEKVTL